MLVSESAMKGPFWAQICFTVIAFFLASGGESPVSLHKKIVAGVVKQSRLIFLTIN